MNLRGEFEITEQYTYLNTAATSPLPKYVLEEVNSFNASHSKFAEMAWDVWQEKITVARDHCASLLGACRSEIAFLKNTGEGINTICAMLPKKGNVVTTSLEFPTNYLPWKMNYRDLRVVDHRNGIFDIGDFEKMIDDSTEVVALSEIAYNTGTRLPVKEVAEIAHAHGAYLVSDAIQALGAVEIDVRESGIDFLSSGGHKWLTSPFGVSIFYIKEELIEKFKPPYVGWFSMEDPDDFSLGNKMFASTARRYEIGNLNFSGIMGLSRSVKTMLDYGTDKIEDEVMILADYVIDSILDMGLDVMTPQEDHGGIILVPEKRSKEIVESLLRKRIIVSHRGGIRISTHFWNNKEDIDALIEEIKVI